MADYQSIFEPVDFNGKPMAFPLDTNDLVDPMNLSSSCQLSDLCWSDKDPFDLFSWNLAGVNQSTFDPLSDPLDLDPNSSSYISSPPELSGGYADYMTKMEDTLSNASPISDPGSDLSSPSLLHDIKSSGSSPLNIDVTSQVRHKQEEEDDDDNDHRRLKAIPRKPSNASTTSSRYSATSLASTKSTNSKSSSSSNTKSSRAVLSHENDAVAVMKRKKAAHNAIEKRYRTNMNAKFLALGNAIPRAGVFSGTSTSLASHKGTKKSSTSSTARGSVSGSANGQQQHEQQQQQNKSEILTNALSYIHELQDENSRLKTELVVLKENLLPRGSMMWRR